MSKDPNYTCKSCGKASAQPLPPHPCPYRAEIKGDSKTLCNCCSKCRGGCAEEV